MEKKLPNNWIVTEIGNICLIGDGNHSGKYPKKEEMLSEGIPFIRGVNFKKGIVSMKDMLYISPEKHEQLRKGHLKKGDVLCANRGMIGKVAMLPDSFEKANLNSQLAWFRCIDKVQSKLLYYQLQDVNVTDQMNNLTTGTALKQLPIGNVKKIKLKIPPLPEQQRIVAKLDELFGYLDTLKTRLNNIPQILKNFRQAVLTQAVTGKLTEEWRVGKELEEWSIVNLKDITTKIGSGSTPRGGSESYKEEGIPLVRSMNIHFNGIKSKGLAFIDEEQAERLKNVIIQENDILLNITGASIGRVCIAEKSIVGGRVNQHVTIIRLNDDNSPEYVNMYLASSLIQNYIFNENYGVTRQALTKTQTQNLEINIPPKEEQTEIVKRVEHLFAKADAIEAQYQSLKTKIDNLPQAILAKAFKGELIAQLDTDGSAKVLLEEIKKLKESLRGTKQSVKRKKK
ncbi:restriction endonuclease subunit S [Olleya sp. 1-3]|uniref:restriction endonuclease subunit S n=1 Tax=Olleya sp. 1-3 TaxID=2058323 RepID=UPI000C328B7E|nr:restriction endonuclease subunit S [Olleya sp. 1-3]PKG52341.1 hypothetical protein CXF54_04530 [Olleya sp. 1-3]